MKKLIYAIIIIVLLAIGYYAYLYWALGGDMVGRNIIGENPQGEAELSHISLGMTT